MLGTLITFTSTQAYLSMHLETDNLMAVPVLYLNCSIVVLTIPPLYELPFSDIKVSNSSISFFLG